VELVRSLQGWLSPTPQDLREPPVAEPRKACRCRCAPVRLWESVAVPAGDRPEWSVNRAVSQSMSDGQGDQSGVYDSL
jgi:hypothetical protein